MENLNILSLFLAALVPMVVGTLWYSKTLFGNAWMRSIGLTDEKIKQANMAVTIGISFLMSLLVAFFLVQFTNGIGQEGEYDSFKHGAAHGLIISIFFVIPLYITNSLFEQKSWKNILIHAGYFIITLTLMGGIVDVMNHYPNI